MISRRRHDEQGFALTSVLLLTMMVMLTAGMVLMPALTGRSASARSGGAIKAANQAEAGIDLAMAALNATIPAGSSDSLRPLATGFTASGANAWTYSDAANDYFFRKLFDGEAPQVTIRIPSTVPVPGGAGVASDYRIVEAKSTHLGAERRVEAIVHLQKNTIETMMNPFPRAVTARGNLALAGNDTTLRTDSYNSLLGPYNPANPGHHGGVHVNGSIVDGGLYRGNVSAVGTIHPGAGVLGPGNTISSGADPEDIPDAPPVPTVTTAKTWASGDTLNPPPGTVWNLGAVSLAGNRTLNLGPGTYVMSSLSTSGNAQINIVGNAQVKIFVTGQIDLTGNGIVNTSQKPTNLHLIATNPTANVKIAGNGNFIGGLQAPANNVTLAGNGTVYGAVVGKNVTFSGSSGQTMVHYDEAFGTAFATPVTSQRPVQYRTLAINVKDKG